MRHLLALSITMALSASAHADTLIYAGTFIDGTSSAPQKNMTIIVDDTTIKAIERGFTTPQTNDVVIDRRNGTVMPGFIDMHTHLRSEERRVGKECRCRESGDRCNERWE